MSDWDLVAIAYALEKAGLEIRQAYWMGEGWPVVFKQGERRYKILSVTVTGVETGVDSVADADYQDDRKIEVELEDVPSESVVDVDPLAALCVCGHRMFDHYCFAGECQWDRLGSFEEGWFIVGRDGCAEYKAA